MSRKNNLKSYKLVSAASLAGSVTSKATDIQYLDSVVYQANLSGSPVGTLKVQSSLDYNQDFLGNILNAGTWNDVPNATASVSASGSFRIALPELMPDPWVRLVYTFSSGSGSMDAFISGKMV